MMISGPVLMLADDVSTDVIYPGRYLTIAERSAQANHALEGMGPEWPDRLRAYPILAAGWNFGCGSSREQAATALIGAGVKLVIARSFSRLFLRNGINNGLPIIECPALVDRLATGTPISADISRGEASIGADIITFAPLPAALLTIIEQGGLLAQLRAAGRTS